MKEVTLNIHDRALITLNEIRITHIDDPTRSLGELFKFLKLFITITLYE